MPRFAQAVLVTLGARVTALLIGVGSSMLLARLLGPEGKGAYTVATLLPTLIITFTNLGIGPATAYHVARARFSRREILGAGLLLNVGVAFVATVVGIAIVFLLHDRLFPGIDPGVLLLGLAAILPTLLLTQLRDFLLGLQRFRVYNLAAVLQASLFLVLLAAALWVNPVELRGALLAGIATVVLVGGLLFVSTVRTVGGVSLRLDRALLREVSKYGLQTQLSGILGFLNYRVDVFIVSALLNPVAVGFYSIGVNLVEQIWLVSSSAATVLFPRVAAEKDGQQASAFTALIARTVLWAGALGAVLLLFLSRPIVRLLYSDAFLPAVAPLQALLPGIVTFGAARVLANDLAGRGRVKLNNYAALVTVTSNVVLNLLWIPRHGIVGAAWASTVSYSATFLAQLALYCRISGDSWTKVVLPQRGDWAIYWRTALSLARWLGRRRTVTGG